MGPSSFERAKRVVESRPPAETVYESAARLSRQIGEHEFTEEGVFIWETPDHHVVCRYDGEISDQEQQKIDGYVAKMNREDHELDWRKVRTLTWEVFGQRIDIRGLIPNDIAIFFASGVSEYGGAYYLPGDKAIYLFGKLLSPHDLVVMLHEAGHVQDWARRYGPEEKSFPKTEELALERAANAYALNMLRPSFSANKAWKNDVMNYLIHGSLHQYSADFVKKNAAPNLRMNPGDWDDPYDMSPYFDDDKMEE